MAKKMTNADRPRQGRPEVQTQIRLWTRRQMADYLNCSISHLDNMRQRGEGPEWQRFGGLIRYSVPPEARA